MSFEVGSFLESPIRAIYVINEASLPIGKAIRDDKSNTADDLFKVGFLSAIKGFSSEVYGGSPLEGIELKGRKILYSSINNYTIILEIEKNLQFQIAEFVFDAIIEKIESIFGPNINDIVDTDLNSHFNDFLEKFTSFIGLNMFLKEKGFEIGLKEKGICLAYYSQNHLTIIYKQYVDENITEYLCENFPKSLLIEKPPPLYESESVVPFPEIKKVCYAFFFTWDKFLGIFLSIHNQAEQLSIYKQLPYFSARCKEIADILIKRPIPDELPFEHVILMESLQEVARFSVTISERIVERTITLTSQQDNINHFKLLNSMIKKGLDRAIRSVIIGSPVILAGDSVLIKSVSNGLDIFSPHKVLSKNLLVEKLEPGSEKPDIIGIDSKLIKKAKKTGCVLVDLNNRKVYGGKPSVFFSNLIKNKIADIPDNQLQPYITDSVQWILEKSNEIIELSIKAPEKRNKSRIEKLKEELKTDDLLDLTLEIAILQSPAAKDLISTTSLELKAVENYLDRF